MIFLVVIVFWIFNGYRRGLIRIIFHFANLILTWGISYLLHKKIAGFLLKTPLSDKVYELVSDWIVSGSSAAFESFMSPELKLKLGSETAGSVISGNLAGSVAGGSLAYSVTGAVMASIAFIITFLSVSLILKLLEGFISVFFKLPVLNAVNKLGGIAAGAIVGCIWGYMVSLCFTVYSIFKPTVAGVIKTSFFMNNIFVNPLFFLDYF